ncbi:O-acetyl-ADP-ribose deacetylase (regulator of RNase III), contains Macro domain [Sphingomonas sp. YR710]|uniref:type II toxin-antitoxin system antitoxin DNA ADP-ribosyl glycohydrolase DarG n=1 Tax=Sphingomonas sp. YR710 TaxID=1882773 RepID=UPI0008878812|nr:macro domain-containing protein [Sphingomonas sp. YR710]SDC53919.1 O-acetyl-ADP-ribose deacetylase (regulator of RNase III), contains Macro domain [Sphingomonas sp. YR710]
MAHIELRTGDILKADAEAIVNTVNCVGIMGRGIALQFKKAFPANFRAYARACDEGEVQPGKMFVYDTGAFTNPRYIVNFPTKRHWKGKSRIEDIESGLVALAQEVRERHIKSIAIPPLGAGLGGLEWADVRPRIEAALCNMPNLDVLIYEPKGAPEIVKSSDVPNMTPGRAALVTLMHRYLQGLMDPFVTLIEVQKLMYFMQATGQPLKLNYVKHHYGPYATNLSHVLHKIEGHFVAGYQDGGDQPDKELMIVPGAIAEAEAALDNEPQTHYNFNRVADLVDGFETPYGLELLATVHWVATREGADTPDKALPLVHGWNERKRAFTPRQVAIAFNTLKTKGWLAAA